MSPDSSLTPLRQYGEFGLIDAMRRILGEPSGEELLTVILESIRQVNVIGSERTVRPVDRVATAR